MRYFIKLSYKGTNYSGWQIQDNAITVQSVVDEKLSLLLRQKIETVGAGRTDAGVHATCFFAHFNTDYPIENCERTAYRLNKILPLDIQVFEITNVHENAHARFDARWRTYHYIIETKKNPFNWELTLFFAPKLDISTMNEAAKKLLSYSDFKSFCKVGSDNKTTVCKVTEAEWTTDNNQLIFKITADRFLRNMVRAIVGTLINVGIGKTTIDEFEAIILSLDRSKAGESAVAQGLYLTKIVYDYI